MRLRDKHGMEFPDLDYERLQRNGSVGIPNRDFALDEMVGIDRDRHPCELEPTLAVGSARRQGWIAGHLSDTAGA